MEPYLYDWWRVGNNLAFEGCWTTLIHKLISHWFNELWCLSSSHWCNRFDGWLHLSLYEEFSGASSFSHLVHNDAIVCSFVLFFDLKKSNSISENVCSNCTAIICQAKFLNDSYGTNHIQQWLLNALIYKQEETYLIDEQSEMIILDDELPPGTLGETLTVLRPVHFRSGITHDLAVERGWFSNPRVDVAHLDTELWWTFLLFVVVFCKCNCNVKIQKMSFSPNKENKVLKIITSAHYLVLVASLCTVPYRTGCVS